MIVVGGENLIDLVSGEPADNGLPRYTANPGGAPYNVAMAVGRQGEDVTYITPISSDSFGDLLAARLVESGVRIAPPRVPQPTSLAVVTLQDGMPSYAFHRSHTAERQITPAGLERDMPASADMLCIGGLALIEGQDADAWEALFARCRQAGILAAMDPNVRPPLIADRDSYMARIRRMMAHVDLIKLSDEDICWLYPDMDLQAAVAACRAECDAALFILTKGGEGAEAFAGGQHVHVPAAPLAAIIDTVGAGDTFMATVLTWIQQQGVASREALATLDAVQLTQMLGRAARAAAINCTRSGCNPPTTAEID